jgi:hypothetical protein
MNLAETIVNGTLSSAFTMLKDRPLFLAAAGLIFYLTIVVPVHAGVMVVADGYQVTYGIGMNPGSSNGSDVESVFIFAWDDTHFSVDYAGTIAGRGNTFLSHVIDFYPTSALILGWGAGIVGIGDEKDHLYTITSLAFSYTVGGLKWSQAFPGVPPDPRVGHNAMINLLRNAESGSSLATDALTNWVKTEGYRAAFDPSSSFVVLEWTTCPPGTVENETGACVPVGGSIPLPPTLALFALGLLAMRRGITA